MIPGIDLYEEVKEELKFLATSGVRIKLLISLNKENMTMDQFRDEFGYRTSTILPVLAELKSKDLIYKDDRQYGLTQYGELHSSKLIEFIEALHMLKKQKRFWKNHETHVIPDLFFRSIGSLNRSTIMEDMPADLFATHRHFTELLGGCEVVNGVSPFIHPDFPDLFKVFVESGVVVRLVVTYPVLKLMCDRHKDVLQHVVNMPNFSLRVADKDVKVAFTVTEKLLSLGFFRLDGTYDYGMDLVSEDATAILWGSALFEYYWNQSVDITEHDCTRLQ